MDPGTAMLISAAVAASAKAGGDAMSSSNAKKSLKRRSKETKRETYAGLFNDALQGSSELEAHGLQSRAKLGKRRAQALQDSSDLVRGAFKI
jgi:hypothetical protein